MRLFSVLAPSLFFLALDFLRLQSSLARSTCWFRFAPSSWYDSGSQDQVVQPRNTFIMVGTLRSMLFCGKSNLCIGRFNRQRIIRVTAMQMRFRHTSKSHTTEVIEPTDRCNRHAKLRFRFDLVHILPSRSARSSVRKVQRRRKHPRQRTELDCIRWSDGRR